MQELPESFSFEIGEKLGEGSYGRVHECTIKGSGLYAVKIMKKTKNGIDCPLELSIMATYRHPFLSYALNITHDANYFYIIQEIAECDLEEYLQVKKPHNRTYWFLCLLQGLQFLHKQNLIHCDIKPSNVLVMNDASVKLTDYSHSVLISENETSFSQRIGSPRYSAPEVLTGRLWSQSVDIWSLGCVFYEISTGGKFLEGISNKTSDKELEAIIRSGNFRKAAFYTEDDKELILDYMLQIKPYDRYTCEELLSFYFQDHPYPSYNVNILISRKDAQSTAAVLDVIKNKTRNTAIIRLTQSLNERSYNIPVSLVKLEACVILAAKILKATIPPELIVSSPVELLKMELQICTDVNFLLHY